MAYSLIPGKHRLNLHAMYGEFHGHGRSRRNRRRALSRLDRLGAQQGVGLDFNPTYFAHEKAADGFTLAHPDAGIRQFWIDHGIACRKIAAAMGEAQGNACVNNVWVPDGYKDTPANRKAPRERLAESLDAIFAESLDTEANARRRRMQAVRNRLARVMSSVRTSSIWATRSRETKCCASTRDTFIRPK